MRPTARAAVLALCLAGTAADVYMHNPAGSNNRNREQNENRNNANRLFDSQNNGKGGYPWRGNRLLKGEADPMNYYEGSMLRVEWTNQHGCGTNENTHCQVVLQYACQDTLPEARDGYPTSDGTTQYNNANEFKYLNFDRNNNDGTNRISENTKDDVEYGMHENFEYYDNCIKRLRNKGLYTADRNLRNNRNSARHTRQNPGGTRYGFECPEERDYYPYWHPAPWRDIAVLTSNTSWCDYYQRLSQNVQDVGYCDISDDNRNNAPENRIPITEQSCTGSGGVWRTRKALGGDEPECRLAGLARDNHLGNVMPAGEDDPQEVQQPESNHYWWTLPKVPDGSDEALCVLRIRYNISTNDYPAMAGMTEAELEAGSMFYDSRFNCPSVEEAGRSNTDSDPDVPQAAGTTQEPNSCTFAEGVNERQLYNRPYVKTFGEGEAPLSVAINTDQAGRTFEDRSYVFRLVKRPEDVPASERIWNLNTRGRRGNIVQSYPSVEYDFTPNELEVKRGDRLHIQWTGSDFNANRNPNNAEGWSYSDRFNMVQVDSRDHNIPLLGKHATMWGSNETRAKYFGLLGQKEGCDTFITAGDNNENNDPRNCGKLNRAPARFSGELMKVDAKRGEYKYVSTRNNNFSNRSQKGTLRVADGDEEAESKSSAAAIAAGVSAGVVGIGVAGALVYMGVIPCSAVTGRKKHVRHAAGKRPLSADMSRATTQDPTPSSPPPPPPKPGSSRAPPPPPPKPGAGRVPPSPPSRPSNML